MLHSRCGLFSFARQPTVRENYEAKRERHRNRFSSPFTVSVSSVRVWSRSVVQKCGLEVQRRSRTVARVCKHPRAAEDGLEEREPQLHRVRPEGEFATMASCGFMTMERYDVA